MISVMPMGSRFFDLEVWNKFMKKNKVEKAIRIVTSMAACILLCIGICSVDAFAQEAASTDYAVIVEVLKEELRNGNLQTEEDVRNAIDKAEKAYGIDISESDEEMLVKLVSLAEDAGIDGEKMADIVDEVYEKAIEGKEYENTEEMIKAVEEEIIDSAAEAVKDTVTETISRSVSDYFTDFVERMKYFWEKLISIWKI